MKDVIIRPLSGSIEFKSGSAITDILVQYNEASKVLEISSASVMLGYYSSSANAARLYGTASYATVAQNTLEGSVSASYALTSSYAVLAQNTIAGSVSASYALSASHAEVADSLNGSIASATSASYALSASHAEFSKTSTSASFATTSSAATSITFVPATASFAVSASWAPGSNSISSSYAVTSSAATSITFVPVSASYADTASYASGSFVIGGRVPQYNPEVSQVLFARDGGFIFSSSFTHVYGIVNTSNQYAGFSVGSEGTGASEVDIEYSGNNNLDATMLYFIRSRGTIGSSSFIFADDKIGDIAFWSYKGSGIYPHNKAAGASFRVITPHGWNTGSQSSQFEWHTVPSGSTTLYLRMILSDVGSLRIISGSVSASAGFSGSGANITGIVSSSYALTSSYAANAATATVGPGTVNTLALFNTGNTVSSSIAYQSGSRIVIGQNAPHAFRGIISPNVALAMSGSGFIVKDSYSSIIGNHTFVGMNITGLSGSTGVEFDIEGFGGSWPYLWMYTAAGSELSESLAVSTQRLATWGIGTFKGTGSYFTNSDWIVTNEIYVEVPAGYNHISGSSYPTDIGFGTTGISESVYTTRWRIGSQGHLFPYANGVYDIGTSGSKVRDIYAGRIISSSMFSGSSLLIKGGDIQQIGTFDNWSGMYLGTISGDTPKIGWRVADNSERFRIYIRDINTTEERLVVASLWDSEIFSVGRYMFVRATGSMLVTGSLNVTGSTTLRNQNSDVLTLRGTGPNRAQIRFLNDSGVSSGVIQSNATDAMAIQLETNQDLYISHTGGGNKDLNLTNNGSLFTVSGSLVIGQDIGNSYRLRVSGAGHFVVDSGSARTTQLALGRFQDSPTTPLFELQTADVDPTYGEDALFLYSSRWGYSTFFIRGSQLGDVVMAQLQGTATGGQFLLYSGSASFTSNPVTITLHGPQGRGIFTGPITASAFQGVGSQITGVISSSYAVTSSYAVLAQASIAGSVSASYALSASHAEVADSVNGSIVSATSASYALTADNLGLTYLNVRGNYPYDSTTWSPESWSFLHVGYSRFVSASQSGAPVLNNFGYFTKIANRDFGGGWGGLWVGYSLGQHYIGQTTESSSFATWEKIWTDANDGAGSGLAADTAVSSSYALSASHAQSASWAPGGQGTVGPGETNRLALFNSSTTVSSSYVSQSSTWGGGGTIEVGPDARIGTYTGAPGYAMFGHKGGTAGGDYAVIQGDPNGGDPNTYINARTSALIGFRNNNSPLALLTTTHFYNATSGLLSLGHPSAYWGITYIGPTFISGAAVIGNLLTNTHQVTGSLTITGSLNVTRSVYVAGDVLLSGSSTFVRFYNTTSGLNGFIGISNATYFHGSNGIYLGSSGTNVIFVTSSVGIYPLVDHTFNIGQAGGEFKELYVDIISGSDLKSYTETTASVISTAGIITMSLGNANVFYTYLTESVTGMAIESSSVPSGKAVSFTWIIDYSGSYSITWNPNIKWPGGTQPTLTAAIGKSDIFTFLSQLTPASSSYWFGFTAGQNYVT